MTQLKLNKSSLSQERKKLRNYKQFLPSLDLKRQKLLIEKNKSESEFKKIKQEMETFEKEMSRKLPMLAVKDINLEQFVKIKSVEKGRENIVGVKLPTLSKINFTIMPYSYFNTPHWIDNFIKYLQKNIEIQIRLNIASERVKCLNKSLQVVTQRKNLFEKVLIPKATNDIRYIQIFLADSERAAVVRSKIAKKKRLVT
jgi:V/A-type H+-transporting ATPase subunit D